MSRDDGFPTADMDSSYFEDAKVRDLWQRLRDPDRMARAMCIHAATLLASWRQGERVTVTQAAPMWLVADEDLLDALRAVKLLDRTGRVPAGPWGVWFGAASQRRDVRRAAGRIGGQASGRARSTDAERKPKQPLTFAEPVRPSVPTVPTEPSEPRAEAPDPEWLKAWWATGRAYLPTEKQQVLIDSYLHTFDVTGDERLAGVFLRSSVDPIAGLKADLAAFRAERIAEAKSQETPKPHPKRPPSGFSGVNAEIAKVLQQQAREAALARHNDGKHAELPDITCPLCIEGDAA